MKRKILKTVILSIIGILFAAVLFIAVVYVLIPNIKEKKLREALAEEARIAEEERLNLLSEDLSRFSAEEYDGVFISMTEASDWSMDIFLGYIGVNVLKADVIVNSADEFTQLWGAAEDSGNDISYCVFIMDPNKLYKALEPDVGETDEAEGEPEVTYELAVDLDEIFGENPDTEFRVFMPFYEIGYWEDLTEASFAETLMRYREVLSKLVSYKNVVTANFSGYDWLARNPHQFNEKGGITAKSAEAFFLYTFRDYWVIDEKKVSGSIALMQDNLWFADPEPVEKHWYDIFKREEEEPSVKPYSYPGWEEYDVVFFGDSVFELSDGPFSIASGFNALTGARTYNISKGGIPGGKINDEILSMPELAEHFISGQPIEIERFEVFNRELERFVSDDHTGRKLLIITDFGTNDYFFGIKPSGTTDDTYEGALSKGFAMLKEAYPEASFAAFSVYYIQTCSNGTDINECDSYLKDYKEVMKKVCSKYDLSYYDLEKLSDISDKTAGLYLDDGTHPSMAGTWEILRVLLTNLTN